MIEITIQINEAPECCAVCDFYKQIIWEDKGETQKSKCLISGRISEYSNGQRTNGFSRYENCPIPKGS